MTANKQGTDAAGEMYRSSSVMRKARASGRVSHRRSHFSWKRQRRRRPPPHLSQKVYVAAAWRQRLNAAYGGAVGGIYTYAQASSCARSLSASFAALGISGASGNAEEWSSLENCELCRAQSAMVQGVARRHVTRAVVTRLPGSGATGSKRRCFFIFQPCSAAAFCSVGRPQTRPRYTEKSFLPRQEAAFLLPGSIVLDEDGLRRLRHIR